MKKILFLLIFLVAITGCSQSNNKDPADTVVDSQKEIVETEFSNPPTKEQPLVIKDEMEIKSGQEKKISLGFFNKHDFTADKAKVGIRECTDMTGKKVDTVPEIISSTANEVAPNETQGYKFALSLKNNDNYEKGTYTCEIAVYKKGGMPGLDKEQGSSGYIYERKQFFLQVN